MTLLNEFSVGAAHADRADDTLRRLEVDPAQGLSKSEAQRRRDRFGPNLLKETRPKSALNILLDQMKSFIVALLATAAALSFVFGHLTEGAAVLVVLVINTFIGFATEIRAVRSMEALRRLSIVTAKVRRDGRVDEIPSEKLVPGDIVIVNAGDIISADMRLVSASRLKCDESVLTGESLPVEKALAPLPDATALPDRINLAFQGTAVTSGTAEGVVIATAMLTELGQIAALAEGAEESRSPLENRLAYLCRQLVWITLALVAIIGVIGVIGGTPPILMIETAIALAVAAVPEGLPMVATLALARGMWRMAQRNALIERLNAVETLGATTVILTDKTGTLTQNRMTVRCLALPDGDVTVTQSGFQKDGKAVHPSGPAEFSAVLEIGVLCNNASLARDPDHPGEIRIVGDPMEGALLLVGEMAGLYRTDLTDRYPEIRQEAFDTDTRMMATAHRQDDGFLIAVKGAPEEVLRSAKFVATSDEPVPLSESARQDWLDRAAALAGGGLRILALASRTTGKSDDDLYRDLTLQGLVGFHDPPREGVAEVIQTCKHAGIRVVMVTGDHAVTARQIADTVGLTGKGAHDALEGADLGVIAAMSDDERKQLMQIPVFARVSPRQKLDLIALYQSSGSIVAMTGDGVNDAPALRKADIGIAMGRRGSQVAREAADVVLQDDALETLVHAIAQGRIIFGNIRKFILYLLSCNLSEIMIVGVAALSGLPLPILPLQILFLNLVTDVFPAFALGAGDGREDVMNSPPRDPQEPLLPRRLWMAIAGYSTVITVATLTGFVIAIGFLDMDHKSAVTISFLTLALSQLWHVFNMRGAGSGMLRNEITRNRYVWGALLLCVGLIGAAVYLPGLSEVLNLRPPSAMGWAVAVGLSFVPLIFGQLAKSPLAQRAFRGRGHVFDE